MERWKSRGGKSQRREEKKKEDQRRERVRRKSQKKEDAGARKGMAREGRKVGSLKQRAQNHLRRWDIKNCTPLWREADLEVKMLKTLHCRSTLGSLDVEVMVLQEFQKRWQGWGIWSGSAKMLLPGRGSTRDTWVRHVRRSWRWFPERGWILEHQIPRFDKMISRDRCNTLYNLVSRFRGRCNTLDRWNEIIAERIGTRPSALHSTFDSWRTSRRIASFLMLSTSKIGEASQNCFVFYVVNIENWRSLAEFLRFWRCQLPKLWKSRRIASISSSQIDG